MKDDWENDRLWNLLGEAGKVSVSPYFSRRVRTAVRNVQRPALPPILIRWLAAGSLALLTAGFFWNLQGTSPAGDLVENAEFTRTFDKVAGIDSLVAVGDFSISDYSRGL